MKCDGNGAGLDGWYAQGQAYAMLKGEMKLFRKIPIVEFVAGAVLQFKGPNPNYVYGDVVAYIDIVGKPAVSITGTFQKGSCAKEWRLILILSITLSSFAPHPLKKRTRRLPAFRPSESWK